VRLGPALHRGIFVSLGYICAVVAATFVTVAALAATRFGTGDFAAGILYGLVITFPTALPGFILALCIAIALKLRNWVFFSLAGAFNVFPATLVLELVIGGSPPGSLLRELPYYCLPGGLLGGLTFWLVAYRSVDAWPKEARA
jgi:hypothetical protein